MECLSLGVGGGGLELRCLAATVSQTIQLPAAQLPSCVVLIIKHSIIVLIHSISDSISFEFAHSINWLTVFFLVNLKMGRSCWPLVGGTVKYYSREQFPNVKPPQFKNDIKIDLIIFPFELYLVSLQC